MVFDRGTGGIQCLGMLVGGFLFMFVVLLPWILHEGGGVSSEQSLTLTGRCPVGLLFLGMLATSHLGVLAGLMSWVFLRL